MNGEIYILKNKINNKVYIGQTTQGSKVRFKQHLKLLKSNQTQLIHKAIKKYGKENFYYEVLYENIDNYEQLNKLEEECILKYNSLTSNGYNMCPGGQKYRRTSIKFDADEINEIIDLYNNGYSTRKIGDLFNVSSWSISKLLKDNNVKLRNKNFNLPDRSSKIKEDELRKLFLEDNLSIIEISKILNVSTKTISRALKRYKIK